MSTFLSRLLVVAIGAPIVLGALWLGGWWLFALVAAGSIVALHEFYAMARPLRPLVLAGYAGSSEEVAEESSYSIWRRLARSTPRMRCPRRDSRRRNA